MKKIIPILISSLLVFPIKPLFAKAESLQMSAIVTNVEGAAITKEAGSLQWVRIEKGMECGEDSEIKTGKNGTVELVFDDGTALKIEKSSEVKIATARKKEQVREFFVSLFSGRMLNNVIQRHKSSTAKFKVGTPSCVAAIRGTVFVADATKEETEIAVFEGVVEASGIKEETKDVPKAKKEAELETTEAVEIDKGKQTTVKQGKAPYKPAPLSKEFESYRKNVAELFNKRIEGLRKNMDSVRKMNEEYMKNSKQLYDNQMNQRQKGYQDIMEQRV